MIRVIAGRVVRYGALATRPHSTPALKPEPDAITIEREIAPEDFRPVGHIFLLHNPFPNTLGLTEKEQIAGCLVELAQKRGRWTRIPKECFLPRLSEHLASMIHDGMLDESPGGVMLTQKALKILKRKY